MRRIDEQVYWGVALVTLSVILYLLYYELFHDAGSVFKDLVANLAFLPISVLLVTVVLNQLMANRDKRARLKKMNMAIGTFFSEIGTPLIGKLSAFNLQVVELQGEMSTLSHWSDRDWGGARKRLRECRFEMDSQAADLEALRAFLLARRDFMLRLLENPNLLEHETMTDLLWAVFHLADELAHRQRVSALSRADLAHIAGDMQRAYQLLLAEWVAYMQHLRSDYPYLFSLAVRTNPFDPAASPEIR